MSPDDISKMIDAVTQYSELMGGMKKQIMAQGFSEEMAEQLVLEIIRKAS